MSWKDKVKNEQYPQTLALIAGDWAITFLSNEAEEYEFERANKTVTGVSFTVNAKHVNSGGNFPNIKWAVTAKGLLRELVDIEDLTGVVLKFKAIGSGLQRKYENLEIIEPKVQSKLTTKK